MWTLRLFLGFLRPSNQLTTEKRQQNKPKRIDSIKSVRTTSTATEVKRKHFKGLSGSVLETIQIHDSSLKFAMPT